VWRIIRVQPHLWRREPALGDRRSAVAAGKSACATSYPRLASRLLERIAKALARFWWVAFAKLGLGAAFADTACYHRS
jgi:hypothetical protein